MVHPTLAQRLSARGRAATVTPLAATAAIAGVLILLAPFRAAEQPLLRVGVLLGIAGAVQLLHGLRLADAAALRRTLAGGAITILMALAVVNAPYLAGTAIVVVLGGSFVIDAIGYVSVARRAAPGRERWLALAAAAGDLLVAAFLLATQHLSVTWLVTGACGLRALGIAWHIAVSPARTPKDAVRTVIDDLGIADRPEAVALEAEVTADEHTRAPSDRRWVTAFVLTLFAIHIARMQADGSLLGFIAPAVAVVGDMLLAMLVVLMIVVPAVVSFRASTRWLERRAWHWSLAVGRLDNGWRYRLVRGWLRYRLRIAIRLREARYSTPAAIRRALATGLPLAAIVAATVPIWGMSWFFDTENWASGLWNSWAESRTDEWREAMVKAVVARGNAGSTPFLVSPAQPLDGDFAFIVIGDTGEGDASQHVLRDQLISVAAHNDVRFLVISSDVVYPNGAMIDYEAKFWLPFKGITKPVYAIPGNHDWYDGLDAFVATFLDADSARTAMHARADAELRVTSTTSERIEALIDEAARLRREYDVPTGYQRAPFFELQTDRFALVAIDTGIVKRIDPAQWAWLESALGRAAGKLTMAVVGHPFYAGGYDMTIDNEAFARLKRLLVSHHVALMMAGDTHDLEYYLESPSNAAPAHYVVNGGGGAYMSFGTALAWPAEPATGTWAFYPDRAAVVDKIESRSPRWKRPAWWWTHAFGAWPFSPEWMSAAFDYNVSPFFQSFIEVRVEPSQRRLRLLPYGVHGRLHWRDLAHSAGLRPPGAASDAEVEWIVPAY